MDPRVNIITLGVKDVEKSAQFYEKIFNKSRSDQSNENIVFIKLLGIVLAIYSNSSLADDAQVNAEGKGFKGFTLAYNAKSEAEVDQIINEVELAGAKIVKKPQKVFWGGYSSYFCDYDENLFEVAFNPFFPLKENGEIDI